MYLLAVQLSYLIHHLLGCVVATFLTTIVPENVVS